jgi:hypothetical protein
MAARSRGTCLANIVVASSTNFIAKARAFSYGATLVTSTEESITYSNCPIQMFS